MHSSDERPDSETVLGFLLSRYSVGPKQLVAPGPTKRQLELAVRAALRAPDHEKLSPFRFVIVPDRLRPALAELFEDFARRSGRDEAEVRAEGARAYNGPSLVAVLACIDRNHPQVPQHEQWICVGGALAGFVNALHLMGFGAKVVAGRKTGDARISRAFAGEGEDLVGWVMIGTPARSPQMKGEDDVSRVLRCWSGPAPRLPTGRH